VEMRRFKRELENLGGSRSSGGGFMRNVELGFRKCDSKEESYLRGEALEKSPTSKGPKDEYVKTRDVTF